MRVVESGRHSDSSACGAADSVAVTWGTTADERRMPFPCDRYVDSPDAAYFRGGIARHQSPDVPSYPASHGCVRLPDGEADRVYRFVDVGTPVVVR